MKSQTNNDKTIAFPLFDLYPQEKICSEFLDPIGRSLFDALLEAGFLLQLVPVLIDISRWNEESFREDGFTVRQPYFAPQAYIKKSSTTNEEGTKEIILDESQAQFEDFQYLISFDGTKKKLYTDKDCNKDPTEETIEYFAFAMIVRAPEMRAKIEKTNA